MPGSCAKHGNFSGNSCTFCVVIDKPIKKSGSTKHRRDVRGGDSSSIMSQGGWCAVHQLTYSGKCCTFCINATYSPEDLNLPNPEVALAAVKQQDHLEGLRHPSMMN
ncbi:hypothetical protein MCOR25_009163 [Pyricularia grisea]|uniref:Uncharacterized protein n=1 Tax=Pyricularia grisea TaxID=148305 RepID=A0A6P8APQ1_PYRGI|nr:hypothetical protein PgNI_11202 [Pyricularia grisea]KAI6353150.1 hypothetical protein MCOR25_009163 [Pyricularia grisea]TLD04002.1 hypothetical protein PgNI_11202 [Pyricularia grisea]